MKTGVRPRAFRVGALLAGAAAFGATGPGAEPPCSESSVLTLLGTDTAADRSLFALSSATPGIETWLVIVDARDESARLLPDSLAGLRSGAFYGPGPFLAATPCGADCFQPVRLGGDGWEPLGGPIAHSSTATAHFTYDRHGSPWIALLSLSEIAGVVDVTAFRFAAPSWEPRGRLRVQAVGAPAATPDPVHDDAVLVGSGRFRAGNAPAYWIPSLPAPSGAPRGRVVAVAGAAAYLTFDSRLYTSLDGGVTWFPDSWTPWTGPGALPGTDYWIDLPAATSDASLAALWHDERHGDAPVTYLARWTPSRGWAAPVRLGGAAGETSFDHAVSAAADKWLLLGSCRASGRGSVLDVLLVDPGTTAPRAASLALESAWSP